MPDLLDDHSLFVTRSQRILSGSAQAVRLSRKERELQFRVEIVLDAAEEVFGEASFAQVSVEDIAHRAEISVGTLYNLFRSKEDVYRGVVSRSQNMYFEGLSACVDAARGPRDQVHALVRHPFEHFSKYSSQFRHYVAATNGFQWELKSKLEQEAYENQRAFSTRVVDICQRGIDQGIFRKGLEPELMAVTLLGLPHSFLVAWLDQEGVDLMSLVSQALLAADRITGAE